MLKELMKAFWTKGNQEIELDVVVQVCNLSTREVKAGKSQAEVQPGLYIKALPRK
jgi:hypothetical protein